MHLLRLSIALTVVFLATSAFSQGLVFQGENTLTDQDSTSSSFGANLKALQERTPEIVTEQPVIRLPRAPDGHFYADVRVNGVEITFLVDTGASGIALSKPDARRVGIDVFYLQYTMRAHTANGVVKIAPTKLRSIILGQNKSYDVPAFVSEGDLQGSLLGMSYLSLFSQIEILGDVMILHP